MRVAIIGGGIAGLSVAYQLEQASKTSADVSYELFEAGSRLGGVISSEVTLGTVLEHGPDSFLTEKPAALQLCRELGLEADLISSNDSARKTYILVRNRLVALPDGLMFLIPTKLIPTALTRLFSMKTKLRMALELLLPPRPHSGDESVAELVARHYGQEVVDRLADPLLSGIYGGDASQLSAESVLPRLVDMEAQYGSLTRGMLAGRRKMKAGAKNLGIQAPKPIFTTLRGGLQQIIDALIERVDSRKVHIDCAVVAIQQSDRGWLVKTADDSKIFDSVVIATPAWASAALLKSVDAALCYELGAIPYTSSITVNLIYDELQLGPLPVGFGFLVPAVENRSLLACTFVHRKFSGRTAPGKAVLRAFLGGARNEELLAWSDSALSELVQQDLQQIIGITAKPELVQVNRWNRAMAQYAVGHKLRQQKIYERLSQLPGLHLVGNGYDGIGISDCIRLGRRAATDLVAAAESSAYAPSLPSQSPIA